MLGRNPFTDPLDVEPDELGQPVKVALRLVELSDGEATLRLELLDDRSRPVLTLEQVQLKQGQSWTLSRLTATLNISFDKDDL